MSEVNEINIPNIVIPNVVSSESWIYGIPNVPSNHPPITTNIGCLLYTSPSPRDLSTSRMPSSA